MRIQKGRSFSATCVRDGVAQFLEYAGRDAAGQERQCGLSIDRVRLPADQSGTT